MRSTFVSTFLSVTRAPAITASLGSVTTPLIAEEEFCERSLIGTKVAARSNKRQKMRPDRDQLILVRFMICMVLPPEWVKRQNAANWKAPHSSRSQGLWEDCANGINSRITMSRIFFTNREQFSPIE